MNISSFQQRRHDTILQVFWKVWKTLLHQDLSFVVSNLKINFVRC